MMLERSSSPAHSVDFVLPDVGKCDPDIAVHNRVALNAQLLRRLDLGPEASVRAARGARPVRGQRLEREVAEAPAHAHH